jgi:hypothetical protein
MRWDKDGDHDFAGGGRVMELVLLLLRIPFHASVTRPFHPTASNRFIRLIGQRNFVSLTICCSAVEMRDEFAHSWP